MKIKLQNKHIITLIPFLQNMKLRGERSRARSKFLEIAMKSYYSLHESENVNVLKASVNWISAHYKDVNYNHFVQL